MILLFPNLDTLRLALSSSIVPAEVTLAPAAVTFDDQGKIYLETDAGLSRTVTKNLDRIGVKGSKRHAGDTPEKLSCWPQALPVAREAETPTISSQAPVLFEMSDADDLPTLATEMLRLGNDRQSFRWFSTLGDVESKRVLLRVIGPPYYTLLRALDRSAAGTKGAVRAYVERAPRVWVEIGHAHPLAQQIRVAEGQFLLIRAPREWIHLDDSPFQDIYEIIQFALPARPVEWMEAPAPKKIEVPLKLTAGNAADVPELWVLRDRAVEQLDALVRDSDDRLTQRLMFAVARDPKGTPTVVLRTRPSKLAPPHLALENAQAYKPFWKLTNLFVPVGKRLHPTLRRDAVRKLLAGDPDQVVWLYPESGNGFTPESVPDGAFRPLEDWVDYVIEAEQKPLATWIEATRFEFDHFICTDTSGPKTKPDKGQKEAGERDDAPGRAAPVGMPPKGAGKGKTAAKPGASAEFLAPPEEVKKPSEWKIRRAELEKRFQEIEGGLDAPERQVLWPQLAVASTGIPEEAEAAISWLNAMWNVDPIPTAWLEKWVRGEIPNLGTTIRAEEFDRLLSSSSVGQKEARTLVAAFLWLAAQKPAPAWLNARLPAVQTYVEKNEGALPVRAVWLAGHRLAQLSGSDVLGLARVRDRTLNRLLTEGLSPEKDLPLFLRYSGLKDSERLRIVRGKVLELQNAMQRWVESGAKPGNSAVTNDLMRRNVPFIRLMFAFALAKLGEGNLSRQEVSVAEKEMSRTVPGKRSYQHSDESVAAIASNWLWSAFDYRIEQAMTGRPHGGTFGAVVLEKLDAIRKSAKEDSSKLTGPSNQSVNPYWQALVVIDRMRKESRILEPYEAPEPYRASMRFQHPGRSELLQLTDVTEPKKLAERILWLYEHGVGTSTARESHCYVLHQALPLAPRVGEAFSLQLLRLVPQALARDTFRVGNPPTLKEITTVRGELIERAVFLAAHFGQSEIVKSLVGVFVTLLKEESEESRQLIANVAATQCLRSMKRFGMKDSLDQFLTSLGSELLKDGDIVGLKRKHASKPDAWARVLQSLLHLAGGWLTSGLGERATPVLNEAREQILSPSRTRFQILDYVELAKTYLLTVGSTSCENGLERINEFFATVPASSIPNTWTGSQTYSRLHLKLVEAGVWALVSDDSALGPVGRKWLDDDEYLVRRRIHADMKRERDRSGI
jgi:hypothetical protein